MHILYLHQYFAFPDIHSSTRSYDLATSFIKKGYKVTVITTTTKMHNVDQSYRWNVIEREGIQFHILTSNYSQHLSPVKRILEFIKFMYFASIRSLKIKSDLVLTTSTPITIALPALIKKFIQRTPFIFEVRDVWPEIPVKLGYIKNKLAISLLYWFEKYTYKKAFYIVALSEGMKESIQSRYKNSNVIVIPNISEINRFTDNIEPVNLKIDKSVLAKKIVLYAGAFGKVNGIKYVALLATETIKTDPDIVFFLIGVGSEKSDVITYCRENNLLNKNVFIFDPVPKSSLPYLYSICTLGSSFVIDNAVMWNNSANKFFDTLAAGKPILINHKGWQEDIIEKENIGYVLPPVIDKDDVLKFSKYINDNSKLLIQSKNALRIAKNEFSLDVATERYLSVFNQITVDV
jgi:glycosyltransferase involved in cell wall biosynthesis